MEIVKSVIIELRPLLRCCNIFLMTSQLVVQDRLKITIRPDCIVVSYSQFPEKCEERKYARKRRISRKDSTSSCESYSDSEDEIVGYNKFMDMKPFCKMVPGSLSNLKIETNSLSFRVLTEPSGPNCSGSFFNEVLNANVDSGHALIASSNERQIINLEKNERISFHCANCSNKITKDHKDFDVVFERILELPSENMDMSEWFCHGTNGKHCHSEKKNAACLNSNYSNFKPSVTDLYYGVCYFVVDSSNFIDNFKKFNEKRDLIHCNRCLSCLGSKKDEAFKFWNSCLKFSKISDSSTDSLTLNLFSYERNGLSLVSNNLPLSDVLFVISSLMKESLIGLQMPSACKMILECEGSSKQSLLIWVMDRNLDVLKNLDDNSNTELNRKEIKLNRVVAAKLLYSVVEEANITDDWREPAVQIASVSKNMFVAANTYFVKNSSLIPESSRKSSGYTISYIYF